MHGLAQTKRRIRLIHWAVIFAICAAIAAAVLVIAAFGFEFLNRPHVYGAGSLFLVSFTLLTVALGLFAQEIRLAIKVPKSSPRLRSGQSVPPGSGSL